MDSEEGLSPKSSPTLRKARDSMGASIFSTAFRGPSLMPPPQGAGQHTATGLTARVCMARIAQKKNSGFAVLGLLHAAASQISRCRSLCHSAQQSMFYCRASLPIDCIHIADFSTSAAPLSPSIGLTTPNQMETQPSLTDLVREEAGG